MYERFTERARQVVVLASQEAREHQHAFIGLPHIGMGLLKEEQGLAATVLQSKGITDVSYQGLTEVVAEKNYNPPTSEHAKRVYEGALREALSMGHNYIGTEHLLLALLREEKGPWHDRAVELREAVLRALQGSGRPKTKFEALKEKAKAKPSVEDQLMAILRTAVVDALQVITDAVQQA